MVQFSFYMLVISEDNGLENLLVSRLVANCSGLGVANGIRANLNL